MSILYLPFFLVLLSILHLFRSPLPSTAPSSSSRCKYIYIHLIHTSTTLSTFAWSPRPPQRSSDVSHSLRMTPMPLRLPVPDYEPSDTPSAETASYPKYSYMTHHWRRLPQIHHLYQVTLPVKIHQHTHLTFHQRILPVFLLLLPVPFPVNTP